MYSVSLNESLNHTVFAIDRFPNLFIYAEEEELYLPRTITILNKKTQH